MTLGARNVVLSLIRFHTFPIRKHMRDRWRTGEILNPRYPGRCGWEYTYFLLYQPAAYVTTRALKFPWIPASKKKRLPADYQWYTYVLYCTLHTVGLWEHKIIRLDGTVIPTSYYATVSLQLYTFSVYVLCVRSQFFIPKQVAIFFMFRARLSIFKLQHQESHRQLFDRY